MQRVKRRFSLEKRFPSGGVLVRAGMDGDSETLVKASPDPAD